MLAIGRGKTKPAQEALFFLDGWSFARDLLEQSGVLFPGMDRDLDEAQTSALFGVTPLTTDGLFSAASSPLHKPREGYASPIAGPKAARASAAALPGSSNDAVFLLAA